MSLNQEAISDRAELVVAALRLSYFTIGWNGAVGVAALILSVIDGSLALAGLGLDRDAGLGGLGCTRVALPHGTP